MAFESTHLRSIWDVGKPSLVAHTYWPCSQGTLGLVRQFPCAAAGSECQTLVTGCQNGVRATRNRSEKSIDICLCLAHRCTYDTLFITQHNSLCLKYNLVSVNPLEVLGVLTITKEAPENLGYIEDFSCKKNWHEKYLSQFNFKFLRNIRLSFKKLASGRHGILIKTIIFWGGQNTCILNTMH